MEERVERPGFFEPTQHPYELTDELCNLLAGHTLVMRSNKDKDYEYLKDYESVITVISPTGKNNLDIELTDEITLIFGGWHAHYNPYVYDYDRCKRSIEDIVSDRACVITIHSKGENISSLFLPNRAIIEAQGISIIEDNEYLKDSLEEAQKSGGFVEVVSWTPQHCYNLQL